MIVEWWHRAGMARLFGVAAGLAVTLAPLDAGAEWRLGAIGGDTEMRDTGLMLQGLSVEDNSFESPFYYGLRLTHWFDHAPLGVMLDFSNAKAAAGPDDRVEASGIRAGTGISGAEPAVDAFPALQLPRSPDMLTLNGLYRPQSWDWIDPYAGLGLGIAIPQVAVGASGFQTSEYQVAGPAAQGLAGLNFQLYGRFSVFAEYKLSYAEVEANLAGGGALDVEPWTNQFIAGVSFRLF